MLLRLVGNKKVQLPQLNGTAEAFQVVGVRVGLPKVGVTKSQGHIVSLRPQLIETPTTISNNYKLFDSMLLEQTLHFLFTWGAFDVSAPRLFPQPARVAAIPCKQDSQWKRKSRRLRDLCCCLKYVFLNHVHKQDSTL